MGAPQIGAKVSAAFASVTTVVQSQYTEWVRGAATFIFLVTYMYLQWMSPKDGAVPNALVGLVGAATGWYLTHPDANAQMKALLSITYVAALCAFYLNFGWAPDAVLAQVTFVAGVLFGPLSARKNGTP